MFQFPIKQRPNDYSKAVETDLRDAKNNAAFETLKKNVQDIWRSEFEDDYYLFKWLKARQFDARKSERMLRDHLEWRIENRIDYILQEFKTPEGIKRYYTGGFCGVDKQSRPVWYDPVGLSDPSGMAKCATRRDLIRSRLIICEYVTNRLLPMFRQQTNAPVYQITVVYDFEHFGKKQMWGTAMDFFVQLTKLCEANYPESMGVVYVVNAPAIFSAVYNLLKPFLHQETQKKVQILGKDYRQILLNNIDADQLPAIYGGNCTDTDGNPKCTQWICQGGDVPAEYFLKPTKANQQVLVGRKSQQVIGEFVVHKAGCLYIEWEVMTDDSDIGITVARSDNDQLEIVMKKKKDCFNAPWWEYFRCLRPGKYVIALDNSHSWMRNKTVKYYVEGTCEEPQQPEYNYQAKYLPESQKPRIPMYVADMERIVNSEDIEEETKGNSNGSASLLQEPKMKRKRCNLESGADDSLSVASYYTAYSHISDDDNAD